MVEADRERAQAPRGGQAVDAVTVLLPEEQIAGLWIDRQAAERGLARPLREGNDEPGRKGRVDWRRDGRIEPIDLRRGVAAPALAQHHQAPGVRQGQLGGPRHGGCDDLDLRDAGRLGVARARPQHEALEQRKTDEATEP